MTFTNTVGRALGYVLATPPTPHDRDHRLKVVLAPEASPRDMADFHSAFRRHRAERLRLQRGRHRARAGAQAGLARHWRRRAQTSRSSTPRRGMRAPRSSMPVAGCATPTARSGSWCAATPAAPSRATGTIRKPTRTGCAAAGSGPETSPTATPTACSGSRPAGRLAAGRLGELRGRPVERIVGRYGLPRRSPSSACPTRWRAIRSWRSSNSLPGKSFDPDEFAEFLDAQSDLGTKWAPRFVRVMPRASR